MAERIGQSKQKVAAMEKLVAQRDEEVKNAAQAVVDANRARDRSELDAERLRKKQERLRSFTDEQTLAATEAAAEKTKLAEELAKREASERKAEDNLRQAVTNAEKENLKLTDKLAQVMSIYQPRLYASVLFTLNSACAGACGERESECRTQNDRGRSEGCES